MNRYPLWTNLLVVFVLAVGALIALPNLYGKAPSVQLSRDDGAALADITITQTGTLPPTGPSRWEHRKACCRERRAPCWSWG